jgi:pterin-4a-carbinolamine dehydratase
MMNSSAQFFAKVIAHPQIMVAHENVQFHTLIHHVRELTEKACMTARHDAFVLKPVVKQIPDNEEPFALVRDAA